MQLGLLSPGTKKLDFTCHCSEQIKLHKSHADVQINEKAVR